MRTGYRSDKYREVCVNEDSLQIPHSNFVKRRIPNTDLWDVYSMYPFLPKVSVIPSAVVKDCISITAISNPLGDSDYYEISGWEVYKSHSVVDLETYDATKLPTNHQRNIKKSKFEVVILTNPQPAAVYSAYENLVQRHNIVNPYKEWQINTMLDVPGAVLFAAREVYDVSYALFYVQDNDAYYQMGVQKERGYELNSNYKLMHEAILFFKSIGLNRLLVGAVPDGGSEGLKRFKEGFASYQVNNYIFKKVLNQEIYDKLSEGKSGDFFPLYRGV